MANSNVANGVLEEGINESVLSLLNGTERGLKRITGSALNFAKELAPYEYLEKLACRGFDKIKATLSTIKNTTWVNVPFKSYKTKYNEEVSLANRTLNKLYRMIDHALPAEGSESCTKTAEKEVPMPSLPYKIKISVLKITKHFAQLKGGMVTGAQSLSAKNMVNAVEHWLSNSYKRLQVKPTKEGILMKTLRLSTLTVIGTTLSIIGVAEATLPRIKEQAGMMAVKSKAAVYATFKMLLHISNGAYVNARQKVTLVIGNAKKLEKDALARLLPLISTLKVTGSPTPSEKGECTKQSNLEERISLLEKTPEEHVKEAETTSNKNSGNVIGATNEHWKVS